MTKWALYCLALITIGLFLLTLRIYFPGSMSPDSILQLTEGRAGVYTDWHPPLMAFMWRFVDQVIPGPAGMLAIQLGLYWLGLYLIAVTAEFQFFVALLFLFAVGLYPGVLGIIGAIWKDVFLVSFLLMSFANALVFAKTKKKQALLLSLLFALFGCSFRVNGLIAFPPLAAYLVYQFPAAQNRIIKIILPISILITLLFFMINIFTNRVLLNAKNSHTWRHVVAYDITGIYKNIGFVAEKTAIPYFPYPLTIEMINAEYTARSAMPLVTPVCSADGTCKRPLVAFDENDPNLDKQLTLLRNIWIKEIVNHPMAYLKHRWNVFREVIGLTDSELWVPVYFAIEKNDLGLSFHITSKQLKFAEWLWKMRNTFFFCMWRLLILNIIAFVIALAMLRGQMKFFVLSIVGRAFLYEISYFIIAPSPDYRYSLWFIVGTIIGCFLLFHQLIKLAVAQIHKQASLPS